MKILRFQQPSIFGELFVIISAWLRIVLIIARHEICHISSWPSYGEPYRSWWTLARTGLGASTDPATSVHHALCGMMEESHSCSAVRRAVVPLAQMDRKPNAGTRSHHPLVQQLFMIRSANGISGISWCGLKFHSVVDTWSFSFLQLLFISHHQLTNHSVSVGEWKGSRAREMPILCVRC